MRTLDQLIPAYERALLGQKRQPRGIARYMLGLRRFVRFLGPDATVDSITAQSITTYQECNAHLAASSLSNDLSVIRSFCRWCIRGGLRTDDPTMLVTFPKRPRNVPQALRTTDLRRVLTVINDPDTTATWHGRRNRRAIYLMLYAGLRLAETAALRWRDVDIIEGYLVVRDGKNGDDRVIPVHPTLLAELATTPLAEQRPEWAVAGKPDGTCLTYRSIENICGRWLRDLGCRHHAHQFRHTFATQMLRNDVDLRTIQELMGHRDLSTTQRYLLIDTTQKRRAVDRLPDAF